MDFIPYEILSVEANLLIEKAALCPSWESQYYWNMYHVLIESFGWTDRQLNDETLRRVDMYWELLCIGKVVPIRFGIKNGIF